MINVIVSLPELLAELRKIPNSIPVKTAINQLETMRDQIDAHALEVEQLRDALEFYANPETYFAVGFWFDRPTGGFDDDFELVDQGRFDRMMPGKRARAALRGEHELEEVDGEEPSAQSWKNVALEFLRQAALVENDSHFDDHLIELRNDGWTVQHPVAERIDGSLFDCDYANWDAGDIGYRGRYVLTMDEEGQLNIGEKVA